MRIREIIWLPDIVEKLEWKHNIAPHEVREALNNKPRIFFRETGHEPKGTQTLWQKVEPGRKQSQNL